ncbi:fucolectin-7-like [Leptodactylus fuscus]|uniref:fucolectin-7-like n=1 Tax=Leptodactylus fuscus TaxID=238119 RepID=UPI003F4E95E1
MNLLSSLILLGSLALARGCSPPGPGAIEIARNGEASQISNFHSESNKGIAKLAINGEKNSNYMKGSCTHTKGDLPPWWQVNLKQIYKISNVVLTNRGDCCKERLMGAEVRIGNSPDNNNPVCGRVTDVSSLTLPFCCNRMEGQYVSVVIPGRPEYLTLCEVEVYGEPVPEASINIARNGEASQISDYIYRIKGHAKNAIDGNKNPEFRGGSCILTEKEEDPWWKLNLKKIYKISNVVITTRRDCCKDMLMGAEIRIGNSPDNNNPVCGKITNPADATLTFCCNGMVGQYVSVVTPGRSEYMTLCEVEVYGQEVTENHKACW